MSNDVEQLNKIQLKAEILTTIKNLQMLQVQVQTQLLQRVV